MKRLISLIFLLLCSNLLMAQNFSLTGRVSEPATEPHIITINNQQYRINADTGFNTIMRYNEFGPVFSPNQLIGFNITRESGELPLITDIWILEP